MNNVETQATTPLTVIDVQRTADTIALITLRTQDGRALPGYEPGCHIDAHLTTEAGEPITRQYSLFTMSPTGNEQGLYGVEVTREHFAHGGAAAMYRLEPGDTLRISALRNNFPLVQGASRSILVGAGVGIAPSFPSLGGLRLPTPRFTSSTSPAAPKRRCFHTSSRSTAPTAPATSSPRVPASSKPASYGTRSGSTARTRRRPTSTCAALRASWTV